MMNRLFRIGAAAVFLAGLLLPAGTVAADGAPSASLRLAGTVPVSCEAQSRPAHAVSADMGGAYARLASLTFRCNAPHTLGLSYDAAALPRNADVRFRYGGKDLPPDRTGYLQLDALRGFDQGGGDLFVRARGLTQAQLARLAGSLQVSVTAF